MLHDRPARKKSKKLFVNKIEEQTKMRRRETEGLVTLEFRLVCFMSLVVILFSSLVMKILP